MKWKEHQGLAFVGGQANLPARDLRIRTNALHWLAFMFYLGGRMGFGILFDFLSFSFFSLSLLFSSYFFAMRLLARLVFLRFL
ncbi:hypothetical protein BGZ63DRAFT_217878 [Mariannaea sp. PMI_226]|nr:hypothetical protein BGZ63DRAFT_217878 [Mariannaea sp. PMI_226]